MYEYHVGQILQEFAGHGEEIKFDIEGSSGSALRIIYPSPTEKELYNIQKGPLQMKKILLNNIIFLTFKFGDLPWMDAPYTPHLSKNIQLLDLNNEKMGLSMIVYLIDSKSGEIKVMRLIGMHHKFSLSLLKDIEEIRHKDFDQFKY